MLQAYGFCIGIHHLDLFSFFTLPTRCLINSLGESFADVYLLSNGRSFMLTKYYNLRLDA
ncbi:hypothetical protein Hanom_Chr02g00161631 [Helianthus anomalus]